MLMFLALTSKWKVSETVPPNATTIVGDNVIVIQCFKYISVNTLYIYPRNATFTRVKLITVFHRASPAHMNANKNWPGKAGQLRKRASPAHMNRFSGWPYFRVFLFRLMSNE